MSSSKQFDDGGFTPRQFPLDPFDGEHASRDPWSLDPESLPSDDELTIQQKTILVLGEPPLDAIASLLHSPHLVSSLLILATARSYIMPPSTSPAVTVLRLGVSLSSSESAASRLAAVLQWADRIARAWRAHPTPPQYQELTEDGATAGYLTPPQRTSWFGTAPATSGSSSAPPSPASSELGLSLTSSRSFSRASKRASVINPTPAPATNKSTGKPAFDALFNFLPPTAPDRHLLKHAILVTTISRPFLTCTLPPPPKPAKRTKRFSVRSRSSKSPAPSTPPPMPTPAHFVHFIPPTRSALIKPLESFCLTFSFPSASSRSAPSLGLMPPPPSIDMGTPGPTPRPYVMPPAALGDLLHIGRKWTLAELILCGALDLESEAVNEFGVRRKEGMSLRSLAKYNRAWLNGVGDLVLKGAHGRERVKSEYVAHSLHRPTHLPYVTPDPRPISIVQSRPLSIVQSRPLSIMQSSNAQSSNDEPYNGHAQPSNPRSHVRQQHPQSPPKPPRSPLTSHPSTSSSSSHRSATTHRTVQPSSPSTSLPSPSSSPHVCLPTPPSSASSSPSTSPERDAMPRNGSAMPDAAVHGNAAEVKRKETGLQTPPYDEKDQGSTKGSTSRKRKGIFAWIKR